MLKKESSYPKSNVIICGSEHVEKVCSNCRSKQPFSLVVGKEEA